MRLARLASSVFLAVSIAACGSSTQDAATQSAGQFYPDTCSRGIADHAMVAVVVSIPGGDAAPACTDLKTYTPGNAAWAVPRDPAADVGGMPLVCVRRLDGLAVFVYDSGGQVYGSALCSALPALPQIGFNANDGYDGPGIQVAIDGVVPGSPAQAAGLQPRDVVRAIDGLPVHDASELDVALAAHAPGDTVTVSVDRGSQTVDLRVTLGPPPSG